MSDHTNGGAAPASLLADLRGRHRKAQRSTTTEIPVPGYGDELVAEYRIIPWDDEQAIEQKAAKSKHVTRRHLHMWMDQLIAACVQLHVRRDGELVPLDPEQPVRWGDPRLAQGLELPENPTARQILEAVFADVQEDPERVPYVISDHHTEFVLWMAGKPDDAEDDGAAAQVDADFQTA
jgi:hypothetical protein